MIRPPILPALCFALALGCGASDSGSTPTALPAAEPDGAPASQAGLSDEFDDASTLSGWRIWHEVKDVPPTHDLLDFNTSHGGMMTLRPKAGGWYADNESPFIYKMIRGDFKVEIQVNAAHRERPDSPPDEQFNSAGLMARDPASIPGGANWVMFNTGRQRGTQIASEGKTTVNSESTLELIDGPHHGLLRMCRVGAAIVLARQLDGETSFTEVHRFDRSDFPDDLQVGLVAGAWNTSEERPDTSRTPDLEATFEYIRFSTIAAESDCTAP